MSKAKKGIYMRLVLVWILVLGACLLDLTGCGKAPQNSNSANACAAYASTWKNVNTNNNLVLKADCTGTDADCNGTFTYSSPSNGFTVGATGTIVVNILTGQPGGLIQANGAKCPALGTMNVSYSIPTANQLQTNYGIAPLTYNQQ